MLTDAKISLIIPVYNLEDCVERTLNSVCRQTYQNLEIIVIDDGSVDNSYDLIYEYSKRDNRIIPVHQDNNGVTSARLKGVSLATGEWIGFVDGDDLIDEDMYEFLLKNALKYNAQISHCGYKMVFPNGRIDNYYNTGVVVEQDNYKGLYDLLSGKYIEPGLWNKLYHKSLIQRFFNSSIMNTDIKNLEDLLMNYYLFKLSDKSIYEDKCKYSYMLRSNSAATSVFNIKKYYDPITVFETIMNDLSDNSIMSIVQSRYVAYLINHTLIDNESVKNDAKSRLKQCNGIIVNSRIGTKLKIMLIMAEYLNPIYKIIRKTYNSLTHIDKKYDID